VFGGVLGILAQGPNRRWRVDYRHKRETVAAVLRSLCGHVVISISWLVRYKYLLPILLAFLIQTDVKTSESSLPAKFVLVLQPTPNLVTWPDPENSRAWRS
jgi:hypothetical protein